MTSDPSIGLPERVIRVRAGLLAAAGVLALSACTGMPTSDPTRPAEVETPATAPTPERPTLPGGVIATGELRDASGEPLGSVTVSSDGPSAFTLDVPLDGLGVARPLAMLSDGPAPADGCASAEDYQLELGDPARWSSGFDEPSGDPSYWRSLLVTERETTENCGVRVVATAELTWTLPPMRPDLRVVDTGRRAGAAGPVLYADDGRPLVYRTVPEDAWNAIAQRFGLADDDLAYLNPHRLGGSEPGVAYTRQLLNLDPTNRGDSETRRVGSALSLSENFR